MHAGQGRFEALENRLPRGIGARSGDARRLGGGRAPLGPRPDPAGEVAEVAGQPKEVVPAVGERVARVLDRGLAVAEEQDRRSGRGADPAHQLEVSLLRAVVHGEQDRVSGEAGPERAGFGGVADGDRHEPLPAQRALQGAELARLEIDDQNPPLHDVETNPKRGRFGSASGLKPDQETG